MILINLARRTVAAMHDEIALCVINRPIRAGFSLRLMTDLAKHFGMSLDYELTILNTPLFLLNCRIILDSL